MRYHFTKHSLDKIIRIRQVGFTLSKSKVTNTIKNPIKVENRSDGTHIATSLFDETHVLRVVYRR